MKCFQNFPPFSIEKLDKLKSYIKQNSRSNRLLITERLPFNLNEKNDAKKQAAVLVPLCNRNLVPSILFTKRSQNVGTHKGHVSFPGGHLNKNEDVIAASLREATEETGISTDSVQILAICQTVPAMTGTLVTPVLGFIREDAGDLTRFKLSNEVSRIFTVPIADLLDPTKRGRETLKDLKGREAELPFFGSKTNEECVWGLTAFILEAVLKSIEPTFRED
jgi:nudix motif 8